MIDFHEILIFLGLMATLGCVMKIALLLIGRRRGIGDGNAVTLAEIAQRLNRLEQGVDATAIEVERIAEGQRFTTKLLTERAAQAHAADQPRPRVNTPH